MSSSEEIPVSALVSEAISKIIRDAFPSLDGLNKEDRLKECSRRRKIIEQHIAPALLGAPPEWAETSGYQLGRGAIFNSGAFCVYWGKDPDSGEIVALLHVRKERGSDGRYKYGALGGYTEKPEQSCAGVLREAWREEVCDHQGNSIITPEMSRHVLILEGKDFYTKDPAVQYVGYACELSPKEMQVIKKHIEKCEKPDYQAKVTNASNGETMGLKLMPLEKIVRLSPDDFTYHRQYSVYREVANRLGIGIDKNYPSSPVGYAISDSPELFTSRLTHDGKRIIGRFPAF